MTHGTFAGYVHGKCRCEPCTDANRDHARKAQGYQGHRLTAAELLERKACLVCRTPVVTHPLVACWRAL